MFFPQKVAFSVVGRGSLNFAFFFMHGVTVSAGKKLFFLAFHEPNLALGRLARRDKEQLGRECKVEIQAREKVVFFHESGTFTCPLLRSKGGKKYFENSLPI